MQDVSAVVVLPEGSGEFLRIDKDMGYACRQGEELIRKTETPSFLFSEYDNSVREKLGAVRSSGEIFPGT